MNIGRVNILIPMAGAGLRFKNAGYKEPKPLIDVGGKPMIKWAMESFDFLDRLPSYRLIFVILKEHDKKYHLGKKLKEIFGENIVLVIAKNPTRGQAETCLLAEKYVDNKEKLFIYNCDTYSSSKILGLIVRQDPDGIIPCFKSRNPLYSYAKEGANGFVSRVDEKKVISNLATTGMYYFKHGKDFVEAAKSIISGKNLTNKEFYVGPCYNELIKKGKKVRTILAQKNYILGTPEELTAFLERAKNF